jgi:hypothetical protein
MTLAELGVIFDSFIKKRRENIENSVIMAVITAHYTATFERAKRIPKLIDCLKKIGNEKPERLEPQTDEEMFNIVQNLNVIYGGEVI